MGMPAATQANRFEPNPKRIPADDSKPLEDRPAFSIITKEMARNLIAKPHARTSGRR